MYRSAADPQAANSGENSVVLIPHSGQADNAEKASAPRPQSSAAYPPEPSQPSTVVEIAAAATNSVAVIGSACFFSVCSVGMLLVNKCAFTGSSFNSGLILGQNFGTCLLALGICCLAPSFRFSPSMSKVVTWAPQVLLFVGTIVSSAAALAIVNVPTFSVFRNSSSLVVAVLEYFILKKTVSLYQSTFLVLSVFGAVVYGWGDLQFSARGYLYSALHVVIASMSAVAVKKLNVQFSSSLEMSFYNNLLSLPLLFIFAAYEYHASSSQIIIRNQQCAAASVPAAFLISLSALISQKLLSATSWMALNNFNKIPVLVLSQFIFSDTYSIFQACGLATSVVASAGYSFSSSMAPGITFRCFDFFKQRGLSVIRTPLFRPLFVVTLLALAVAAHFSVTSLQLFTSSYSKSASHVNYSAAGPSLPTEGIIYEGSPPPLPPLSPPPPPAPPPPPTPMVTIVCAARNDDYGGNTLARYSHFLRSVDRFTIPVEIMVVEWNLIQNRSKLSEVFAHWNQVLKFRHPIVVVEVSKENHELFCRYYNQAGTKYSFQEYPGKNVGFRRARGKYIVQTNPDDYFTIDTINHIEEVAKGDMDGIIVGSPNVRIEIDTADKWPSISSINDEETMRQRLDDVDKKCLTFTFGSASSTLIGDFMLFKRERVLNSRGFPEYPSGFTNFEGPFHNAFFSANPGSQYMPREGFTVHHFDHSRAAASGLSSEDVQQNADKISCPNPPPKNDENWGLVHLNLSTTVIYNRHY